MAATRKTQASSHPRRPPAKTPEARENQLVSLAFDLAERQLRDGSATSQVITHYLKLGTTRERLEQAKIEREVELLKARSDALESTKRVEELYAEAMREFRKYNGSVDVDDYDD